MKRLTTLCAAVLMAAMSFAAVEYVLPAGAVTNDYGWTDKGDMFADFMTDAGATGFETLDYYMEQANPLSAPNICAKLTDCTSAFSMEDKWLWLRKYIVNVTDAQIAQNPTIMPSTVTMTDATNSAAWRYAVGAFFCSIQNTGWPPSADFTLAGAIEAFQPTWKHGFENPKEVSETYVLNNPYMEGMTFDGWYTEAEGKGTKITTIDATTTGTLYAYFVPYINTVGEIIAMVDGTKDVQVKGVVTFIQGGTGSNFWIQDATGGILCYGSNHGLTIGEEVVLQGEKTTYSNSPELNNAVVVKHEAGTPVTAQTVALSAVANVETAYLNQLVYIEGLKMKEYQDAGSYKNPVVTDGTNEVILYNMGIEETDIPVGTKINVKAVVGIYNETIQLRGNKEWVELSAAALKDETVYPVRGAEADFAGYTLSNNWIFANTYDNYSDNVPGPTDFVRGMTVKNGIMYFVNRNDGSFTRVNGATGLMLDPLPITGEHLFQEEGEDGVWSGCVTLAFNDVKVDNAGNLLIGACLTTNQRFQVYKVDSETGAATVVIDDKLIDHATVEGMDIRFDAFGVYGDVNGDAVIMAANANGWHAFRWNIKGGQWDGNLDVILLNPDESVKSLFAQTDEGVTSWTNDNPGTAPQIFPLEGGLFYVDGFNTLPMLFDAGTENPLAPGMFEAYELDDFAAVPTGVVVTNNEGEECSMNFGHNGLAEFQVGAEYFLLMAATNTIGSPKSAFALYKYKDAAKSFAEMEPLWFFPAKGMGEATNGCRTAVPSVEVKGTEATLYLYTNNNGYAAYTFTGREGSGNTGVENVVEESFNKAQKVLENGVIYIYRNGVRYNVMGAQVK